MKKWYQWFYLSLGFALGGILNYFDGRRITAAVLQVSITLILGIIQFFCDKRGEQGRAVFKYIAVAGIILLVVWMILLLLGALR